MRFGTLEGRKEGGTVVSGSGGRWERESRNCVGVRNCCRGKVQGVGKLMVLSPL